MHMCHLPAPARLSFPLVPAQPGVPHASPPLSDELPAPALPSWAESSRLRLPNSGSFSKPQGRAAPPFWGKVLLALPGRLGTPRPHATLSDARQGNGLTAVKWLTVML